MHELFPNVTHEIVDRSDWLKIAEMREDDSPIHLSSSFNKAVTKAKNDNDLPLAELYELLSQVFSMSYRGDDSANPFGPMLSTGTSRTAVLSDFTEQNLAVFLYLLERAQDPFVTARLADVLWLRQRNHKHAEHAFEAYLEHGRRSIQPGNHRWIYAKDSLQRAAQLCRQLGQPTQLRDQIIDVTESLVRPSDPEQDDNLRSSVLELMAEFGLCRNPKSWSDICDELACRSIEKHDYERARSYWRCAENLAQLAKDKSKNESFRNRLADSFVEEARWLRSINAGAMIVASKFGEAIEACRRVGGRRELIDALHIEMNDLQKAALQEMKGIDGSIDVTQYIQSGRKAVEGVPFDQAIANIAAMAMPPVKDQLRAFANQQANQFPFLHMVSGVSFNNKGRVVARTSPIIGSDEDTKEAGILAQMTIECFRIQQVIGVSQIEASRQVLDNRVPTDATLFYELVTMNRFVPQGREEMYGRGLSAGLRGDWLICAHLLIPQLEHSIRSCVERSGILVTRLTEDLTQKEHDLNTLLYESATAQIFGDDLVFSMRVLLVDAVGGNFRNKLAHGLLTIDEFHPAWVNYLWALTIRLCWLGKLTIAPSTQGLRRYVWGRF